MVTDPFASTVSSLVFVLRSFYGANHSIPFLRNPPFLRIDNIILWEHDLKRAIAWPILLYRVTSNAKTATRHIQKVGRWSTNQCERLARKSLRREKPEMRWRALQAGRIYVCQHPHDARLWKSCVIWLDVWGKPFQTMCSSMQPAYEEHDNTGSSNDS